MTCFFFIQETDICNFADDTTLYGCGKELDTISFKLEIETNRAMRCLKDNEMIADPSKFQLMFLSKYFHTQNLQILMVEVYKCPNNISPPFTWDYFKLENTPYHLRNTQLRELSKCRTKTYGLNARLFKGALLWNKLPNHFKEAKSLVHFKNKIWEWTGRSGTSICS